MIEHRVQTAKGAVHVNEYPGDGPPLVMTHGFPDDSHIYDRLIPHLPDHHIVTFDFLGHGRSARDASWPMTPGQREGELATVIDALKFDRPVLVGHDIGGPVVIRYALANPERAGGLLLLNTFFGDSPTLEFPEFIRLLADPHMTRLADLIVADPTLLGPVLLFTDSRLNPGPPDPDGLGVKTILPEFFGDEEQPDSIAAIRAWTSTLFPGVAEQNDQIHRGDVAQLDLPVAIAFGDHDPYFNPGVAEHLHGLFRDSTKHLIRDAAHWPQWDQPQTTAVAITDLLRRVGA